MKKLIYYILVLIIIQLLLFQHNNITENFINKGFIRSSQFPNFFIKRTANRLKLNRKDFNTKYIWIYDDDKKIKSQYNTKKCLDIQNKKLKLNKCKNSGEWNYIGETGQIKFNKPIDGENKCLHVIETPERGKDNKYSLKVKKCGPYENQAWLFH